MDVQDAWRGHGHHIVEILGVPESCGLAIRRPDDPAPEIAGPRMICPVELPPAVKLILGDVDSFPHPGLQGIAVVHRDDGLWRRGRAKIKIGVIREKMARLKSLPDAIVNIPCAGRQTGGATAEKQQEGERQQRPRAGQRVFHASLLVLVWI